MCVGFRVFICEYEWAYAWVWNESFEAECMGLQYDFSDLVWVSYDWESDIRKV